MCSYTKMDQVLGARTPDPIIVKDEISLIKQRDVIWLSYATIVATRDIRRRNSGQGQEDLVHLRATVAIGEETEIQLEGEILAEGLDPDPEI